MLPLPIAFQSGGWGVWREFKGGVGAGQHVADEQRLTTQSELRGSSRARPAPPSGRSLRHRRRGVRCDGTGTSRSDVRGPSRQRAATSSSRQCAERTTGASTPLDVVAGTAAAAAVCAALLHHRDSGEGQHVEVDARDCAAQLRRRVAERPVLSREEVSCESGAARARLLRAGVVSGGVEEMPACPGASA